MGDWIEWSGGDCPVADETIVDVRLGSMFPVEERGEADIWLWHWEDQAVKGDYHIIAYRVVA